MLIPKLCLAQVQGPSQADTAVIAQELTTWLASPHVAARIADQKLAGGYRYTLVMGRGGIVETVYADANGDESYIPRQNAVTRLLREFKTTSVKIKKGQRLKFHPAFQL